MKYTLDTRTSVRQYIFRMLEAIACNGGMKRSQPSDGYGFSIFQYLFYHVRQIGEDAQYFPFAS